ncbi:pullulanase [Undibacterium sp. GrIS 1.8]
MHKSANTPLILINLAIIMHLKNDKKSNDVGRFAQSCVAACLCTCLIFFSSFGVIQDAAASVNLAAPSQRINPTLDDCNSQQFQTVLRPASIDASAATNEARAVWLNRQLIAWPGVNFTSGHFKLVYSATAQLAASIGAKVTGADGVLTLSVADAALPEPLATRFKYLAEGVVLGVKADDLGKIAALQRQQVFLVQENADGIVIAASSLQLAGVLDDLYAPASELTSLGVSLTKSTSRMKTQAKTQAKTQTRFSLWAPTAQRVWVCTYDSGAGAAHRLDAMQSDVKTGAWNARISTNLSGQYYRYLVDVIVPHVGLVRNRVTDPYSISLTTDSKRSYIADLAASQLQPAGWRTQAVTKKISTQTDMVVYELHVRDFSINDASVSKQHRGKYMAFTEANSNGMRHLKALAQAGLTDIHLLPVFDFGSVPEKNCVTPKIEFNATDPASEIPQAEVTAHAAEDCFNWGYDPTHYGAPEGSYATDAADGAVRILELRNMVLALHQAGLRVGMDVVYNHTYASGQKEKSVLDRIVPGYYHRLNERGAVEQSTCCDNTATENRMMGKLMVDTVVQWANAYKIDSFRFDLMAHQPRAVMEQLKAKLLASVGHDVQLIGEGWNFGEVANGARFIQASQLSLNGSGIATFSDRARDAIRGAGSSESGDNLIRKQGYINGLFVDPNAINSALNSEPEHRVTATDLMEAADMVRVGLAGSIRDYTMLTRRDTTLHLEQIPYGDQPAGYVSQPSEVVNYIENHDNQTLFDINVYKLPLTTSKDDRVRVQMLGAAINAFSQGIAYFHAGIDTLRSKSMDKNSFESGDWFNRLDWTYTDNYFGTGLPPKPDNAVDYPLIRPLLSNPAIKPDPQNIAMARDMFRDLLRIRASSSLFRLRTAADIRQRLHFYNTGSGQNPAVIAAHIDGVGYPDSGFKSLMYFINVSKESQQLVIAEQAGKTYQLHPVQSNKSAADPRPAASAKYVAASGEFTIPARTAVVFVESL